MAEKSARRITGSGAIFIMGVILQCIVEGESEQNFVEEILLPHLSRYGIFCICHVIATSIQKKTFRGGGHSFSRLEKDIRRTLGYRSHYVTTMVDYYGSSWKNVGCLTVSLRELPSNRLMGGPMPGLLSSARAGQ